METPPSLRTDREYCGINRRMTFYLQRVGARLVASKWPTAGKLCSKGMTLSDHPSLKLGHCDTPKAADYRRTESMAGSGLCSPHYSWWHDLLWSLGTLGDFKRCQQVKRKLFRFCLWIFSFWWVFLFGGCCFELACSQKGGLEQKPPIDSLHPYTVFSPVTYQQFSRPDGTTSLSLLQHTGTNSPPSGHHL